MPDSDHSGSSSGFFLPGKMKQRYFNGNPQDSDDDFKPMEFGSQGGSSSGSVKNYVPLPAFWKPREEKTLSQTPWLHSHQRQCSGPQASLSAAAHRTTSDSPLLRAAMSAEVYPPRAFSGQAPIPEQLPLWVVPSSAHADVEGMRGTMEVGQVLRKAVQTASPDQGGSILQQLYLETGQPMSFLEELDQQGLLQQIPRDSEGRITSVGSIAHARGKCSPCVFWFKSACAKGLSCTYCHFRHKGQKNKRIRPSKKTRQTRTQTAAASTIPDDLSDNSPDGDEDHEVDEIPVPDGDVSSYLVKLSL